MKKEWSWVIGVEIMLMAAVLQAGQEVWPYWNSGQILVQLNMDSAGSLLEYYAQVHLNPQPHHQDKNVFLIHIGKQN